MSNTNWRRYCSKQAQLTAKNLLISLFDQVNHPWVEAAHDGLIVEMVLLEQIADDFDEL